MRLVSEGAEAKVYGCNVLGIRAVAKQRISKAYRIPQLDEALRFRRTRTESRIMSMLYGKINLPALLLVSKDTIYMSYVDGKRLSNMLESRTAALSRYLKEAGRCLAVMHNENITHGDFTPANLIVGSGKVNVIDFGLSYATSSMEDKAIDILLMKRSVSRDLYLSFLSGYRRVSRDHKPLMAKLAEIELRGRYQSRTLATVK